VLGAARAGAIGYVLKDSRGLELRQAIKSAAAATVGPPLSSNTVGELHVDQMLAEEPDLQLVAAEYVAHQQVI
jgi:DNA-binding NarL/FixJ family response regulator